MKTKALLLAILSLSAASVLSAPSPQKADCEAAKKLADGIGKNIDVQKKEQSSATAIEGILKANPIDQKMFADAKTELLKNVNEGIKIREENQKMAPTGNAAIAGLAIVADAQKQELTQSESLKGEASDMATVTKLLSEFDGGIKQNEKNKADAIKGCA